jgi:hypothetical protein
VADNDQTERIVDAQYVIFDGEKEEELKKGFYRTKDKYNAAYLRARGFIFRGVEKIILTDTKGRKKPIFRFCFDGGNVTRRALFDFYNTDDPKFFNVNAKLIFQELRNVNSLIGNF